MMEYKVTKPVIAVFLALAMVVSVAVLAAGADWTTFQGNNDRNGVTPGPAPIGNSTPLNQSVFAAVDPWGTAGIDVTPIVADGKVFVVSYDGAVRAYYKNNLTEAWVNDDWAGHSTFQTSTPVYAEYGENKTLYVALTRGVWDEDTWLLTQEDPVILALDATTGNEKWHQIITGPWAVGDAPEITTPLTFDRQTTFLYFGTWNYYGNYDGTYYAIDTSAAPGIAWSYFSLGSGGYNNAGAAVIGNYLVFGDESGNVTSVNKATGAFRSSYSFSSGAGPIRSSITYNNGAIYFTTASSWAHAIGFIPSIGAFNPFALVWNTQLSLGTISTSTPAVYNDRVYVGVGDWTSTGGNHLYVLNAANGNVIWTYAANGGIQASPVIYAPSSGVYIYFATNEATWGDAQGKAYCVKDNGGSASLVWDFLPEPGKRAAVLQGVAISDGSVYFGNDAGYLFRLYQV